MKIHVLPAARADLLDQYVYLLEHASDAAAERFLLAAETAFSDAAENPRIGTPILLEHPALQGLHS